jgi:hypothetical protein
MYKVKDEIAYLGPRYTQVNGQTVALVGGPTTVDVPATPQAPPRKVVVREATQADLKFLFEQGSTDIEKVEAAKPEGRENKA